MNDAAVFAVEGKAMSVVGYAFQRDKAPSYVVPECQQFTGILLQGSHLPTEPPDKAESATVLDWAELGIVIPWPKGMTAKQAVEAWILGRATEILNTGISIQETP